MSKAGKAFTYFLGIGLLGGIFMTIITPTTISILFTPPVSFGTNCEPAAAWSMSKLVTSQAVGVVVGGMTRSSWRAAASALVLVPTAWWFGAQVTRSDEDVVTVDLPEDALFGESASAHHLLVDPEVSPAWKIWNTSYGMYLAVLASMLRSPAQASSSAIPRPDHCSVSFSS